VRPAVAKTCFISRDDGLDGVAGRRARPRGAGLDEREAAGRTPRQIASREPIDKAVDLLTTDVDQEVRRDSPVISQVMTSRSRSGSARASAWVGVVDPSRALRPLRHPRVLHLDGDDQLMMFGID
jgi:hypothetical protein